MNWGPVGKVESPFDWGILILVALVLGPFILVISLVGVLPYLIVRVLKRDG